MNGIGAIVEAMRRLEAAPPAPLLFSHDMFPGEVAIKMTDADGRDAYLAGPGFWAGLPKRQPNRQGDSIPLGAIEVIDARHPDGRQQMTDFLANVHFGCAEFPA